MGGIRSGRVTWIVLHVYTRAIARETGLGDSSATCDEAGDYRSVNMELHLGRSERQHHDNSDNIGNHDDLSFSLHHRR